MQRRVSNGEYRGHGSKGDDKGIKKGIRKKKKKKGHSTALFRSDND